MFTRARCRSSTDAESRECVHAHRLLCLYRARNVRRFLRCQYRTDDFFFAFSFPVSYTTVPVPGKKGSSGGWVDGWIHYYLTWNEKQEKVLVLHLVNSISPERAWQYVRKEVSGYVSARK